ncbi:MAG TPA: NPCBM/NEW2 domain-containing protein, partial [Actinoplanes sp.]|nr:NPCBM/NEW2 domain-containing protein [Actinoplanes sp.]
PPMGFNNWNTTGCTATFNEAFVLGIADKFVSAGLKDAGYTYVNLDDCWALPQRDAQGNLVPDPVRFPGGIKAVADYVHAKGLTLGIYTSAGTKTCNSAGFPGGLGHETADANLFASWGIDYLKYDNCNNQGVDAVQRYTTMRDALKATGRPIVFSICEWGQNKPWLWAKDVGHLWRTTGDISDNYPSMLNIAKANMALARYAGPGHWNDPDMLEVGNGGMTDIEYRSHFSLWAIMAAPLLIGTDLRKASPQAFEMLGNSEVIAVDQDKLGVQAGVLRSDGGRDILVKPLVGGDKAVVLFNEADAPQRIATSAIEIGLPKAPGYAVRDLWAHTTRHTAGTIAATVPAHGSVMVRVSTDRRWPTYPPAVDFGAEMGAAYPGAPPIVAPGTPTAATTTVTNLGVVPVFGVSVDLRGPAGWQTTPTSSRATPALPGRDHSLTTTWQVTAPAGATPGRYDLTGTLTYWPVSNSGQPETTTFNTYAVVPPPPPAAGIGYVSDLTWLRAANGYGPVEKDTSNGERPAGDGKPITIGGVVFAKGLGVHAPGTVEYFVGGKCSSFTASVGVDDEKTANGSVTFEVWADGRRAADSGLLTTADPAAALTADVTGAAVVRLIVTDGGDGNNSDHADWADAKITCA